MSQTSLEILIGNLTIAEFARFAGTTIDSIVVTAFGARAPSSTKPAPAKAAPAKKPGKTARGAITLDAVLAALASVGASAQLDAV